MAVLWYFSSQPRWPVPEIFDWQDKLMHMSAYAVLGGIAAAWRHARWPGLEPMAGALAAWAIAAGYGVVDEWHQSFVPGRAADPWDALADAVGAACAVGWLTRR
ncbi:MAG: VanZ family protein [Zetaproteobacteria bacterium]|nr:MAG: VanZ family protein [Zetaproteobacteria bacterium]